MNYAFLQDHIESHFNQTLQICQSQHSDSEAILPFLSQTRKPQKPLPTDAAYVKVFAEVSSLYFSQGRRKYRLEQNYTFLIAHKQNGKPSRFEVARLAYSFDMATGISPVPTRSLQRSTQQC
jgi:hypothetical protein